MSDGKLIQVIKSFSKSQLRQIDRFIHSPSHNEHEGVKRLFGYFRSLNEITEPAITREKLFAAAYPESLFDDKRLRHVCSYLLTVLQDYLVFKALEQQPVDKQVLLLKEFRGRHLEKPFRSLYIDVKKKQARVPIKNEQWHYNNYLIEQEQYNATIGRQQDTQQLLESMSVELDHFYLAAKLQHACHILSHGKVFKTEFEIGLLPEIVAHVQKNQLERIPAIGIYYHIFLTISEGSEQHFIKLKALIEEHEFHFPQSEMRNVYLFAINYCIRQINQGNQHYFREVFELYRKSLDSKVLLDHETLSPWTYKNINFTAIKLNELDWAEQFTISFKPYVGHTYRTSMFEYNMAKIKFAKGGYKEVTRILNQLEIKDLFTNLDAKITLIKAYYALDDHDHVAYLLNGLKQLLKRREIMTYHKQNYSTFITFMAKLIKLGSIHISTDAAATLAQQVHENKLLPEREWLLAQLNQK